MICKLCKREIRSPGYLQFVVKHPICRDCMEKLQKVPESDTTVIISRVCTMDSFGDNIK